MLQVWLGGLLLLHRHLAGAGCRCSPSGWLSEGMGPQAPSIMADKASATKRVVTFDLIFYFGGLTPKDLIFV